MLNEDVTVYTKQQAELFGKVEADTLVKKKAYIKNISFFLVISDILIIFVV